MLMLMCILVHMLVHIQYQRIFNVRVLVHAHVHVRVPAPHSSGTPQKRRQRTAALSERAGERRTELLQLASKLQRTEAHLSTLAAQARQALGQA